MIYILSCYFFGLNLFLFSLLSVDVIQNEIMTWNRIEERITRDLHMRC